MSTDLARPVAGTPSTLPQVPARRLRRPSWRDPRLAVGVVLVLASVVLGVAVVSGADRTSAVWAADSALTPGDEVVRDRLRVVDVRLDDLSTVYLSAEDPLPEGAVVTRHVAAGELLPLSALGGAEDLQQRPVGVPVTGALPAGLGKGSAVDLWVAHPDPERAGAFLAPERLVQSAVVSEVSQSGGALGSGGVTTVQVLVAEAQLAAVLGALANDAVVSVVLVPGSGG
ncbi:hypothetical protein [Thalassiella azotivora]